MLRSLYSKLLLGFLSVILLMGILSLWAMVRLYSIENEGDLTIHERLEISQRLSNLNLELRTLRHLGTQTLLSSDTGTRSALSTSEMRTRSAINDISSYVQTEGKSQGL